MKIFTTSQTKQLDAFTIVNEPISSIDLMERAVEALFDQYSKTFPLSASVLIVAGPGNNGGDALGLARKLMNVRVCTKVILLNSGKLSKDCELNKTRLQTLYPHIISESTTQFQSPVVDENTIIIDGLFGSGLTRPLEGIYAEAVNFINRSGCRVLSIDIPSGLNGENNPDLNLPIVRASNTFTFQYPKLAFLFPDTATFVGEWQELDIHIHPTALAQTETPYVLLSDTEIHRILKKRKKFSHKGSFGHAIIYAGCKDMAGAAVLSTKAALRAGAGLVTIHSAACNRAILQTTVSEAIFQSDNSEYEITEANEQVQKYNAVAIGPGIGVSELTEHFVKDALMRINAPVVLDADALNIIAKNRELIQKIPENSILTPHPKEFERLFGSTQNCYERLHLASTISRQYGFNIVLKGAYTEIFFPDGTICFNPTGNAGMATGGSGDVLTGILVGLLAQGYSLPDAVKLGVYLHGLAADLALEYQSEESLLAGDIIEYMGRAFKKIRMIQVGS